MERLARPNQKPSMTVRAPDTSPVAAPVLENTKVMITSGKPGQGVASRGVMAASSAAGTSATSR